MKINITFQDNKPKLSIYGLEGVLLQLWGRTEHIVSKDPMADTISTWFSFFIEQADNNWKFSYKSNCDYIQEERKRVLRNLLDKANQAIVQKQPVDLSQEFDSLDQIVEPYTFGGLFAQMNERHVPVSANADLNLDIAEMREILKRSMTADELETDEHLKSFVFQIASEIIWVDETLTNDKTADQQIGE